MPSISPLDVVQNRFRDRLVDTLTREGFTVPNEARVDVWKAILAWKRLQARAIEPCPRSVHWSNELRNRTLSDELCAAIDTIVHEAETGIDLNPRLTRKFFKTSFNDRLHNDLAIHHFHLGNLEDGKNGMVSSTSELLFAYVDTQDVYLLDLLDHEAFKHVDLVELMWRNWPQLFREARGLIPGQDQLSAEERALVRKAGLTCVIQRDGNAYFPPGGGLATDGTAVVVVDRAMSFMRELRTSYQIIVENLDSLAQQIAEITSLEVNHFDLHPFYENDEFTFHIGELGLAICPRSSRLFIPDAIMSDPNDGPATT